MKTDPATSILPGDIGAHIVNASGAQNICFKRALPVGLLLLDAIPDLTPGFLTLLDCARFDCRFAGSLMLSASFPNMLRELAESSGASV